MATERGGVVYFKRFRKSAAFTLGIEEQKVDLTPLDEVANLYYERGKIEEKIGSKEKAKSYFEKAEEVKISL